MTCAPVFPRSCRTVETGQPHTHISHFQGLVQPWSPVDKAGLLRA